MNLVNLVNHCNVFLLFHFPNVPRNSTGCCIYCWIIL